MTKKPLSRAIHIVAAKRTPFGTFGGALKDFTATDLAVVAAKAALQAGGVSPEVVDTVVFGNVAQTSADAIYLARHVGLKSGVPIPVPALTVNRLCGSGFQAVVSGVHDILAGDAEIALVGGSESMSQAPHVGRGLRWGARLGVDLKLEDSLWTSLTDPYAGCSMAITAENLAEKYGISRAECDAYGLRSQQGWAAAQDAGRFAAELAPIEIKSKKGSTQFAVDEHPRRDANLDNMAKLPASFKKDGVVTAGNASGICDGGAALVLASEEAVKRHNLTSLARIVQWHVAGVEPTIMGIGPVPAIRGALARAGLAQSDVDLFEINEAFAAQYLACEKELGLDREKTNVDGGAIALGHPLGASGARITAHLVHELRRRSGRYAVGAACIGGGQGIALVLEHS
ncbi:acetyl-CoA C-acetyltransferase [Nannocystis sp. ILAH1]|uniref:acetyl-CoA C-acetyltransferase n=1 Tax=unclassified Nannocystis TaxID=2627009 RepID=UPI002271DB11|nr:MULTISPECIES: acetyl-CoA C-acetyltransferase [unclassified Nannocystis]MCY0988307.1 acetyl-CoA C-acetyltransferase [Nannocystis sp. ILAH1]MCY1067732.1 acetyl-CoA C-acetyltransferase [Nannocystis sp. RBIL2]